MKAVSFVGSTPIARYVYENGAAAGKRVQALGGAKNHMVVLPDADLDLAADSAVNAGFGSAGERCMAISVIVAVEPVADRLIDKITERMSALRIGDGTRGTDMGPLVTGAHRDKVASYLDAGVAAGARLVVDGRDTEVDGESGGFWLGPTLFDGVTPEMTIYSDEIFGPVLSIVRVRAYEAAVDLVNSNPWGNGTAIFTNDGGAARRFESEVEVGMVGVNVPIPVPVAYYSFGGWKQSLFGRLPRLRQRGRPFLHEEARSSRGAGPIRATAGSIWAFPPGRDTRRRLRSATILSPRDEGHGARRGFVGNDDGLPTRPAASDLFSGRAIPKWQTRSTRSTPTLSTCPDSSCRRRSARPRTSKRLLALRTF